MKTIQKLVVLCLVLAASTTFAQKEKNFEKQKEKIEAQKIAFITQKLDLTPDEAQKFWPVYNEFNNKRKEIMNKHHEQIKICKNDSLNIDALTDKQAEELTDQEIKHMQQMLDLKKEYHSKFKAVLTPKKLLKLYQADKDFKKDLVKHVRKHDKKEMRQHKKMQETK